MIQTSELYKELLEQGAIQEYKIVVDGIDYTGDVIYDGVSLKQQLFSTDTFSVGGFALAKMTVKLKVPTIDIPRNASVKFFYRLTDYEQTSEWIQKFNGRILKRKRYSNEVTTIEAVSKGANYDVFLDIFQTTIPSYPANNRTVVNLCASHLGLEIDDINKVFDGDNVEYPNELTIIEVLQNIAALSGGNWIITEDDKLRLVVLENTIPSNLKRYSAFNMSSNETLLPISKVTMYYQDDKAFTSGDDSGSELTIDCPWATQLTTDYVLNLYRGYIYTPVTGTGVNIDGAIQLGDSFLYDNDEVQLVANIDYSFKGALAANINAPTTSEIDYEDIYKDLTSTPFKRKVTLGDSYQGVTIDRRNGITMLLSPDGTAENAIAKYYADLNKGMAFQYRDSPNEQWQDWLYFDIVDKKFKLMLDGSDLEGKLVIIEADLDKIRTEVENIHLGNILPNANGNSGYMGWTGDGETLYVDENMLYLQDITYGTVAIPKIIEGSKSEYGWEYYNKGTMYSSYMRVIPEEIKYSFRAKIGNFKPIKFTLYEYKNIEQPSVKQTTYNITQPMQYITFTHTNQNDTQFMKLGIEVDTATIDSRTTLTEIMFNARNPKEWFESASDVAMYSKSLFEQLSNKMVLMVDSDGKIVQAELGVNPDDGSYFVVSADNISLNGYTEINGKFRVNEDGTVYMQDANVEGKITAVTGKIGDFTVSGGNLFGDDIILTKRRVWIGDASIGSRRYQNKTNSIEFNAEVLFFNNDIFASYINNKASLRIDQISSREDNPNTTINFLNPIEVSSVSADAIIPIFNNQGLLGSSSLRFQTVYLTSQPNVSSDVRYKDNILPIDNKFIDIFGKEVEPRTYTMKGNHEIHFGYIAQDVERALYKYCLSKYGLSRAKEEVVKFALLSKSESYMSLLYGEIAVIMDAYNRRRMDNLEKRILALEERND